MKNPFEMWKFPFLLLIKLIHRYDNTIKIRILIEIIDTLGDFINDQDSFSIWIDF